MKNTLFISCLVLVAASCAMLPARPNHENDVKHFAERLRSALPDDWVVSATVCDYGDLREVFVSANNPASRVPAPTKSEHPLIQLFFRPPGTDTGMYNPSGPDPIGHTEAYDVFLTQICSPLTIEQIRVLMKIREGRRTKVSSVRGKPRR